MIESERERERERKKIVELLCKSLILTPTLKSVFGDSVGALFQIDK
jgi:hypothetical protein